MYESKISAKLLYHFTKNPKILVSILKNGFYPMTAIEDISFMLPNYSTCLVGIPMVCFTDLPLNLAELHRKEYGQFGIGMKKEWGMENGLNPVNYIVKGSSEYVSFNYLQTIAIEYAKALVDNNENADAVVELMIAFMDFAGYLKEYSKGEDLEIKPFYDEREWRYLPPFKDEQEGNDGYCNRLLPDIVENAEERKKLNKHVQRLYTLKFSIEDVEVIVLPNEDNKVKFMECANKELDGGTVDLINEKIVIY